MKKSSRKRRRRTISLDRIPDIEGKLLSPLEILITKETEDVIHKAIGMLNDKHRTAIVLYYFSDISVKKGAELMQVKPKTFESYLFRGRRRLHDALVKLMKDD